MDSSSPPRDSKGKRPSLDCDLDLTVPPAAHVREEHERALCDADTETDSDSSGREATELRNYPTDGRPRQLSRVLTANQPIVHWYDPTKKFWRHQVRISVPHEDCRDHLANERTYLGYLRSSLALSMVGTVIAQFYALEKTTDPSTVFGYAVLGRPLSVIFQSSALLVVLLGGIRFIRQQNSMALGKVHAGGWELFAVGGLVMLLLVMMFGVHVGLIIYQDRMPD